MFKLSPAVTERWTGIQPKIDPLIFKDPLATKIDWIPVTKNKGANFASHQLKKISPDIMKFVPTWMTYILSGTLIIMGFGAMMIMYYTAKWILPPWLIALAVVIAGCIALYMMTIPIVFDKTTGVFLKGRRQAAELTNLVRGKKTAKLEDVRALQILARQVMDYDSDTRMNRSYFTYELNLVMKDTNRLNVVTIGNIAKLREDAEVLAEFLDKPVWDATI